MIANNDLIPKPKVVVIENRRGEELIRNFIDIPSLPVEVVFEGGNFEEALDIADKYRGEADVFITGESIVDRLRKRVSTPVVQIIPDGLDIVKSVLRARRMFGRVQKLFLCHSKPQ